MQDVDDKVKVINVQKVEEKDIGKIEQVKQIIRGLLKALYDDKFTNFLLSSGFLYMIYVGIIEEYYLVSVIYGFAFFKFKQCSAGPLLLKRKRYDNEGRCGCVYTDTHTVEYHSAIKKNEKCHLQQLGWTYRLSY